MTAAVAALFVDTSEHGIYPRLLGPERCWGVDRDARGYAGPDPVVAHPPCNLWVNMAAQNYARAMRECPSCRGACSRSSPCKRCGISGRREPNRAVVLPAWYPGGTDGCCFLAALGAVARWGGVLEHPAESHAFAEYGLSTTRAGAWNWAGPHEGMPHRYYFCEVWQSAYGHAARKRTWLLYCGVQQPFELRWAREPGTHQVGWFDRAKPTLSKREASATPPAFAEELIRLAAWSRGTP